MEHGLAAAPVRMSFTRATWSISLSIQILVFQLEIWKSELQNTARSSLPAKYHAPILLLLNKSCYEFTIATATVRWPTFNEKAFSLYLSISEDVAFLFVLLANLEQLEKGRNRNVLLVLHALLPVVLHALLPETSSLLINSFLVFLATSTKRWAEPQPDAITAVPFGLTSPQNFSSMTTTRRMILHEAVASPKRRSYVVLHSFLTLLCHTSTPI